MYNLSEMLLLKMYNHIYPGGIPSIELAPNFRLLIGRGGYLTIEQFRNSFNKIEYIDYGVTNLDSDKLKQKSLCNLFEEKIKF